uniref:TIR domain-containing protein n=1 Tax=Varanus komodoensis TaxID=61221 RepID=A0A8D2IZ08_VARKO
LTALWLLLCLVTLALAEESAVSLCQISTKKASCRGQNLFRVPRDLPNSLELLDLSFNKIEQITPADFSAFTQLRGLDLSYNNILSVANDSFVSNVLLEKLSLFNNSLREIPSQALKPLKNLQLLSISNNLYPTSALDEVFSTFKNLEDLSLGGPAIYTVKSQDFLPLEAIPLKKFALKTASSLMEYQKGAFSKINATIFWCDIALDKNAEALPRILHDLSRKPMQQLRFRNLFEFKYYTSSADLFSSLAEVEVKELVFYRGKFTENLLRLVLLNVRKSSIRDLSFIAIDFARSPQWNPPEVGITNLTLCRLLLKDISNPDILRFDWTFTYIFNEGCLYRDIMAKLEQFNLSYNALTSLRTVARLTSNWPRLSQLDLSHNPIGGTSAAPCRWSPSLVWLALANSAATTEVFRCLPTTLRFLDLSHSQLERLDMGYFEGAADLQELHLSGNKIKFIPTEWSCPSLRVLQVDGNSFGVIGRGSFAHMPRLVQLKAGNNPYHCVCELYSFLQEARLSGRLELLDWPGGWTCYHPEALLDTPVAAYAPGVTECDVTVAVAIAASVTAAVVAVLMVLCWRFDVPWYLRATFQIVRSKYRARRSGPVRQFTYHAFISYSCADAPWVRQELLRRLEASTPPYRVCIHERDFTPGRWIIDNIIENIESSRKVIFVLSRSFVDSDWCNYELYFAHQRGVGLGFEDMVLVVKEAIDPQALPSKFCKLRKMLSSKTFLEWPSEPSRQPFFWIQLTSVLGKADTVNTEPKNDPGSAGSVLDEVPSDPLEMSSLDEENTAVNIPGS